MPRAEFRKALDSLCPAPELGWLTFGRILRLSYPKTHDLHIAGDFIIRAYRSFSIDPSGPVGARFMLHALQHLANHNPLEFNERVLTTARGSYYAAVHLASLPHPELHTTKTRTFHPEICALPTTEA